MENPISSYIERVVYVHIICFFGIARLMRIAWRCWSTVVRIPQLDTRINTYIDTLFSWRVTVVCCWTTLPSIRKLHRTQRGMECTILTRTGNVLCVFGQMWRWLYIIYLRNCAHAPRRCWSSLIILIKVTPLRSNNSINIYYRRFCRTSYLQDACYCSTIK